MSTTISAVVVNLLATLLPLFGVTVGSEDLTKTVQVLVAVATGLWIWYQRTLQGDVKWYGARK